MVVAPLQAVEVAQAGAACYARPVHGALPISWVPGRGVNGRAALDLDEGPQAIGADGRPDTTNMKGRVYPVRSFHRLSDRAKVRKLKEMAISYGKEPAMRFFVVNTILRPAGVTNFRDYPRVAAALLKAAQTGGSLGIIYTNEPDEQLQSPWWTIKVRTGDCDDLSLLLAAMAHAVRLPWRFVLGGHGLKDVQYLKPLGKNDAQGRPLSRVMVRKVPGPCRWAEGTKMPRGFKAHHIYLDLGWPPFSETKGTTTWAAAEPSVACALGYDVMNQGMPPGAYGSWGGPQKQRQAAGHAASLPELGSVETSRAQEYIQAHPLLDRVWESLDWSEIIAGAVSGTIQAVVIAYMLNRLKL